jgi:hypothetical protein
LPVILLAIMQAQLFLMKRTRLNRILLVFGHDTLMMWFAIIEDAG